jgi:hypothetical protein
VIFENEPYKPGDIVEISMATPGVTGAYLDPELTVYGIRVELEERFKVFDRVLWRAKFVDRLGSLLIHEEEILVEP